MDTIKKYLKTIGKGFFNSFFERSIRVYIQKHLGEFLLGKLTTDQVDFGLDGGSLASLSLNCEAINERLEGVNIPFTLVAGYIDTLHLKIPWAEISTESIIVEVEGLMLELKLKESEIDDGIDVKSMFESMTASMVAEVIKSNAATADIEKISEAGKGVSPFESVEIMSEFISSITSRIQVKMTNIVIRTDRSPGVCVELSVERLEYYDMDSAPGRERASSTAQANRGNYANLPSLGTGFSNKVVEISKVTVKLEEVWSRPNSPKYLDPLQQSSQAFDVAMSSPPSSGNYMHNSYMTQSLYPGMTNSMTQSIYPGMTSEDMERDLPESGGTIPIVSMDKLQTVTITLKNDDNLPGPTVDVSWNMESFHVFMSPKLLGLLTRLLSATGTKKRSKPVPMTLEDYSLCDRLREAEEPGHRAFQNIPVWTTEKHIEVMHGATAESVLSEEDMFYSTHNTAIQGSHSACDMSDSASVSTFTADSTFSTFNNGDYLNSRRSKGPERTNSRSWDEHTVETQNLNLVVPFFTITLLLEDPEPCTVIPGASLTPSTASLSTASLSTTPPKGLHSSFLSSKPGTGATPFSPSSLPESFISSKSLASHSQVDHLSFYSAKYESDDEDEFHDSGEYITSSVDSKDTKQPQSKAQSMPGTIRSTTTKEQAESPPRPVQSSSTNTTGNQLKIVATSLFEALATLEARLPLNALRDAVAEILPLDHLGLIAKPVSLTLGQDKKSSETKLRAKVTFGKLEIIECLFDCCSKPSDFAKTALPKLPQYAVLLAFDVNSESENLAPYDPFTLFSTDKPKPPQSALTVTIDSVQTKRQSRESPVIKVSLDLHKMNSEVDVTILDRLTNLLHLQDTKSGSGTNTQLLDNNGHIDEAITDEQAGQKLKLDIQLKAIHATLRVRFPIPDLRADKQSHSRDWCRRNLHKEFLLLEMESPEASTDLRFDEPWQLALQVFKISAYFQEDINIKPILFGEVTVEDVKDTPQRDRHHFNWPRIVINVSNKTNSALETEEESDASGTSMDNYMEPGLWKRESGPFSKRKSLYERDDLSISEKPPDNDEMVMPGDANELRQFREECLARTCLSVEVTIPSVTAFIHSREFLELLYNRFNNDLLMWEPQPHRPHHYMSSMAPSNTSLNVYHIWPQQTCDTASADNDSSGAEDEEETMQYSIHDNKFNNKTKKIVSPKLLNKTCFSLSIGNGRLLAIIPHVEQEVYPELHAEMMITLKDGLLFSVNEHGGDPELKYLCLQANSAYMYHNSHVLHSVKPGQLDHFKDKVPHYLKSRIYRSDRWVSDKSHGRAGWGDNTPDMVTLVVKTKLDTINNIKNFTMALRVDGATLRHEMHHAGESWVSQMIDCVDLKDFPIKGYTMPKIKTEIHLQLDHCCVDYRPLHLPIWTFLTVEHFSICSNIIAESVNSQIRLLLDDSALFITNRCNKEVNLLKDYICVAEVDQLKIWLQFSYDKSGKQKIPKSDLRFQVNELNVHTCADSTRAILDLIQYIVRDGDLEDKSDAGDITPTASDDAPAFASDVELGERKIPSPVLPSITPEQEASVMTALEEAMVDCPEAIKLKKKTSAKPGKVQMTRVFFQCDEARQSSPLKSDLDNALHITISDSSDSNTPDEEAADTEEFEIVDCHFKEVTNMKGSHEVHMLSQQSIEVTENFIRKPTSSYDHLKAPDKFPDPEYQYTLREMSVVWHIYGGSDFSQPRRGSSTERNKGLTKGMQSSSPREQRKSDGGGKTRKHSWRHRGGDWRDFNVLMELDLNKIRFRYDVYPTTTKQASRFKLLVNSLEVRDRIKTSEVNKFLVKLVDKDHPEQSSAYMLMFSGVFTRPEYLPFRKECEVKAFCLPIKLNIDQVSLNFLWKFISQVSEADCDASSEPAGGRSSPIPGRSSPLTSSPRASVTSTDPIMRIRTPSTNESSLDETELLMKFEDFSNQQSLYLQARLNENDDLEMAQEDLPVFIKSFILISDITIKLDYRGKRCDMDSGMVGMMLGVASLTGSVVRLKQICCQKGILGWDKLLMYAYNEWLNDIKTNQIHSILKGVGSLSIIFQIVQGVTDLIRLPIEQYQKDRRIIRGLQRGANSFTLNTVMAILELTNKVVGSIQYCAELGYDMMSPGPSVRRRKQLRQNSRQPRTTAEGAKAALALVTEGVKESASNLSAIVSEESAHKGYVGVVGGALRNAAPECLFKPLALLAEAGNSIVQGVRNEVDPSKMKEDADRWK